MEMTKKNFLEVMNNEYLDAMGIFAGLLERFEDTDEAREALEDFDDVAFEWAMQNEIAEEWMAIYSGLMYALDFALMCELGIME